MLLNNETFARVRQLAADAGYPTAHLQYSGAETYQGKNLIWFTVADRVHLPRRGARLGISENFELKYVKVLRYSCSVTTRSKTHSFGVACSRTGRTLSTR